MKRVLISGYYGFDNTGDEAILEALTLALTQSGVEISVLSRNPERTQELYKVKAFNRFNIIDVFKALKGSDVLISGGGSLFQDVTSSISLYYYLAVVQMALIMKKNVYIYSQGIGPINKRLNRNLFSKIVNKVKSISVRDNLSYEELLKLRIHKPSIDITSDPVFLLQPASTERGLEILSEIGVNVRDKGYFIGVAVRPWKEKNVAAEKLAEIADKVIEEFNAELIFFPFHYPCDLDFVRDIIQKMRNKPFVLENRYLPSEIMSVIGLMDVNIGIRLHSLIFSACMGVPMIGISYDPKIDGFLNSLGVKPICKYEDLSWEKIKEAMLNIRSNYVQIKKDMDKYVQENRKLARKTLDCLLEDLKT